MSRRQPKSMANCATRIRCAGLSSWMLLALLLTVAPPGSPSNAEETAPSASTAAAQEKDRDTDATRPAYTTESLRGQVVWLAEALRRRYGIETDSDAEHWAVALETPEGELYPLVKDARGRGFFLDPRIRGIDMELLVRRYEGSPVVQVIQVYTLKPDGKYEFDYWCDICSIPMYELKPCECCQQEIRIRERLVEPGEAAAP